MRLTPAHFNRHLANLAQAVDWQVATPCPCRNARSNAADPACPVCHGLGTTWGDPVRGTAALSGQKVQQEWAKFGRWESGDQVITIPSDSPVYAIGPFDKLIMVQSTIPLARVLRPGEVPRGSNASIDSASWIEDGALVTASHPPVLADDGTLSWPAEAPPATTQFAIHGRRNPEYFLLQEFPQDRAHHGGLALPRRVVLRAFDLFGRG